MGNIVEMRSYEIKGKHGRTHQLAVLLAGLYPEYTRSGKGQYSYTALRRNGLSKLFWFGCP